MAYAAAVYTNINVKKKIYEKKILQTNATKHETNFISRQVSTVSDD